jgi:hypothetical protein
MSKGHLNNEHATTMEGISSSIVALLLEEGKVIIPELGYLELKVFPDKRTVLFKATENTSLFLVSEGSIQSLIYNNVSVPLREGQMVNLPEIGIFRPMKNADGSYRISYTISSALRKLLNDGVKKDEAEKPEIPGMPVNEEDEKTLPSACETQRTEISEGKTDTKEETGSKTGDEDIGKREKVAVSIPRQDVTTNRKALPNVRNASKVGDVVVPQEEKRSDGARMNKSIIAVAAIIVFIFVIWYLFQGGGNNKEDNRAEESGSLIKSNEWDNSAEFAEPIDLPFLAEKNYGNRIFWVYIYEANRDKISSPVNIPAGTVLRIPNLWEDYKVDIMDSLEIKRAGVLSDIMLKQKVQL